MRKKQAPQLKQGENDEINLRELAASLRRQVKVVAGVTGSLALLSGIYANSIKPIWEGKFEIVLENQDTSSGNRLAQLAAANPMLAGLAGMNAGESSLKTEVKILESQSVLKPVFEFVIASKESAGQNVSGWVYEGWTGNLDIELIKGTSVLSLAYRDTDKSLVLPVLERISNTYQNYSGQDRRRGLKQGVAYLEKEIDKLQQQSARSMRSAQAYALANGLGIQDGMPAGSGAAGDNSNRSVESSRETAQNKVNELRQRISAVYAAGNNTLYQAPQLEANSEVYNQLQGLEARLQQKSALLTPQDQSIQALQRERKGLISYINQQTIGLLQGELITAEAQLASLTRPREVVLKHRELLRTALRDEKTLAELEVHLQNLNLERTRLTDPWELISTPTVLDHPVAPRKKRIIALGLFGGLVLGSGLALIKDRLSDLVFSEDELTTLISAPMLDRLPINNTSLWQVSADLLVKGPLSDSRSVALIPVGNVPYEQVQLLQQAMTNVLGNRQLLITKDLLASRDCQIQVLLAAPGAVKRKELQKLREHLTLQGTPIAGWLMIEPEVEA